MYDCNDILFFQQQVGEMKLQLESVIKENERYINELLFILLLS